MPRDRHRVGPLRALLGFLCTLVLLAAVAWGSAALWFDGPAARWLAGALGGGFLALCLGALLLVRPYRRALLLVTVAVGIVVGWWESSNRKALSGFRLSAPLRPE